MTEYYDGSMEICVGRAEHVRTVAQAADDQGAVVESRVEWPKPKPKPKIKLNKKTSRGMTTSNKLPTPSAMRCLLEKDAL